MIAFTESEDYRKLPTEAVEYRCYCNRDRVTGALKSIGPEAINEMAASGETTEVECQFCIAKYSFTAGQLTALLC